MLFLYQQFILRQAVKNPLYIVNPPVLEEGNVFYPRYSVIHYLDTETELHFPNRALRYFKDISKNKKIPVQHIIDLTRKEDISVLENKHANAEIRKWSKNNIREFKEIDLLEFPNKDTNLISMFNYNILKDLYRYRTSILSTYNRYFNLNSTYWWYVKKAIESDIEKESIHFVSFKIPTSIPTYNILDILLKLNTIKFSRVIKDHDLIKLIDLYRWLHKDYRDSSSMKDITDEDSRNIVIEFNYKGYITFLPLYILKSLCEDSKLESSIKYDNKKVRKLYVLMLRKIQDTVLGLLENNIEDISQDTTSDTYIEDILPDEDESSTETVEEVEDAKSTNLPLDISGINTASTKPYAKLKEPVLAKIDNFNEADGVLSSLDSSINKAILDFDTLEEDSNSKGILKAIKEEVLQTTDTEDNIAEPIVVNYDTSYIESKLSESSLDSKYNELIEENNLFKILTATELRNLNKLKEARKDIKSPFNPKLSLNEDSDINTASTSLSKEEVSISVPDIVDSSLATDVIGTFDRKYLSESYKKDILASIVNIEKAGVIIKNYEIEEVKTSVGDFDIHKLTIKPLTGKESTIYFRLPKIDSEGEMEVSSIRLKMRKQRTELPIRKISPIKVALTTNYSKLFISRTERKTNNREAYIVKYIQESYMSPDGLVKKLKPGLKKLGETTYPNIYHTLASNFNEVITDRYTLLFKPNKLSETLDNETILDLESKNLQYSGYLTNKDILVVDYSDTFYNYSKNMEPIGTIDVLLNIDSEKLPHNFTTIKILGDDIPLGVVLGYYLGLDGLLSVTNTKFTVIPHNKQYKPTNKEIVLKFIDYKLIVETDTPEKELLFSGYTFYKEFTKMYELDAFSNQDVYLSMLEFRGSGLIHLKELNLLRDLFIDPISATILKDINEPTDYLKLLLRANELLRDFSHPDPNDPRYSRIRGYDRIPGLMYKALSESIRDYKIKGRSNSKIELDPYKVWNYVTQDSTVKITEDINPVLDLKESEMVTISGKDGIDKEATPMHLRVFHKNDMGLFSESTSDSSDVGINTYLTPYPKFKDTRGTINNIDPNKIPPEQLFSTSALLTPMVEHDDMKRINFISIQNSHTIASIGYRQPIIRTEYEYVMPYKVGSLYTTMAKQDGIVLDKTEKLLTVRYKDNTTESIKLGIQYGRMEGSVYPHPIISNLTKGSKFKVGDYLSYNTSFFEPDWLDESKLVMKMGRDVTIAIALTDEVLEDSSAISKELSEEMSSYIIKEKIYVLEFNKNIINILPVGSKVSPNTILFTVVDSDADFSNLSESTITMLQNLASISPKAKVEGIIDKYEVKYNGEKSDMSSTFRKLTNQLEKEEYEASKGTSREITNCLVTSEYRSEGKNLRVDTIELKVFIKVLLKQNIGSKGVFAGQMKSVISSVYSETMVTESGTKIDGIFSISSILNRIVNSPILMGTTTRLTKHVSKKVADMYFSS